MKETGVMYSIMVHALRAFRSQSNLLANTMDVFVKEPSFDWKVGLFICTFHFYFNVPVIDLVSTII